jgi:Fic family protein
MEFMDDWEKYYHAESPDRLVQLAVIHAQFEIIHPFVDGNGRIGRMLIPLFLFERKLLSRPMFYLSAYLDKHRDEYVGRLRALGRDKNAWMLWTEFFLTAIESQARLNAGRAKALMDLYVRLKADVIRLTRSRFAIPLLDELFRVPVFQISLIEGKGLPSRPMLNTMISRLQKGGLLKVLRPGSGRRGQLFALAELVNTAEGRKVF